MCEGREGSSDTLIICLTHVNVWESMGIEALQLHAVYIIRIFFTTRHVRIRIRYCKSRVLHLNVQ